MPPFARLKNPSVLFMILIAAASLLVAASPAQAIEPANPELSPKARAVLDYLESVYGERVLAGMNGTRETAEVVAICGKKPAIMNFDMTGWNSPTYGKSYTNVVRKSFDAMKGWADEGGLVTITFHWKNPMREDGKAWSGGPPRGTGPFDMERGTTPGTDEYQAVMRDLAWHADYLEELRDADIPVLFRPLHEIDGGWFWWTDAEEPENTAELYRIIFNYYTKERKLNNLIWVYNAGLKCKNGGGDDRGVTAIEMRKRFYPGDAYVDISGIDIYPNDYYGWAMPQDSSYQKAFDIMSEVTPGKILAFSEGGGIPNPDMMEADGPRWLYCLPWWADHPQNPKDWVKKTMEHPLMITLDELPDFDELAKQAAK